MRCCRNGITWQFLVRVEIGKLFPPRSLALSFTSSFAATVALVSRPSSARLVSSPRFSSVISSFESASVFAALSVLIFGSSAISLNLENPTSTASENSSVIVLGMTRTVAPSLMLEAIRFEWANPTPKILIPATIKVARISEERMVIMARDLT